MRRQLHHNAPAVYRRCYSAEAFYCYCRPLVRNVALLAKLKVAGLLRYRGCRGSTRRLRRPVVVTGNRSSGGQISHMVRQRTLAALHEVPQQPVISVNFSISVTTNPSGGVLSPSFPSCAEPDESGQAPCAASIGGRHGLLTHWNCNLFRDMVKAR